MKTKLVVTIKDCYKINKNGIEFQIRLENFRKAYPDSIFDYRSLTSMKLEWAVHKLLYKLHICRSRTKDLDLDYPQSGFYRVAYSIFGCIAWIFIK